MKKEKTKVKETKKQFNKGITLIALVITIIVLLILAGVSIAMLTGENGVLTKATESKEQTEIGQEKEEIKMAYAAAKTGKVDKIADPVTADELNAELDKLNSTGTASGSGTLTVTFDNGHKYTINQETGAITGPTEGGEVAEEDTLVYMFKKAQEDNCLDGSTCNREDHLHIGDYVNYEPVVGTTKESKKEENGYADQIVTVTGKDEWRVLGLSEDGTQVLLTSDGPIKEKIELSNTREGLSTLSSTEKRENFLGMYGAESYVNCEQALDNISSAFGTGEGAEKAVSMRMEDVNRTLGVVKEGNGIYLKEDTGRENNIDLGNWLGRKYTTKEEEYTPESFLKGEKLPVGTQIELTAYGYEKNSITVNDTIKNLIFEGTDSNTYWLASPGVRDETDYAHFSLGVVVNGGAICGYDILFSSYGGESRNEFGVRPVVYLQSDVTKDTISKIVK